MSLERELKYVVLCNLQIYAYYHKPQAKDTEYNGYKINQDFKQ